MKNFFLKKQRKHSRFFLCGYLDAFLLLDAFVALLILLVAFTALSFSFYSSFHGVNREHLRTLQRIEVSNTLCEERRMVFEKNEVD